MNYQRRQAIPLFTCFRYKDGPLHLIDTETGCSFCRVDCNPNSPLDRARIERFHGVRLKDLNSICKNCSKHSAPQSNPTHDLPDIPDHVFLSFTEYHQLLSEYNSMESAFDPSTLLDVTIDQPMTRRPPLPPGDYIATVGDLKTESWTKKDDPSKKGVKFNVTLKVQITDPVAQAAQGGSEVQKFDTIFLDQTATGGIDFAPGKNTQLRRYREALKMNEAGQSFVPRQMIGRSLRVRISHRDYQGELQDQIDSVASV